VIVKIWLRWQLFAKFYEILFKLYFCLYSAAADHPPPSSSQALGATP